MLRSGAQEHCKENFGDDLGFCGLSVDSGDCLFLREEMAAGTLVRFPVACLDSSEKKKNILQCLL